MKFKIITQDHKKELGKVEISYADRNNWCKYQAKLFNSRFNKCKIGEITPGEVLEGTFDIYECSECGWISPEHLNDLLSFLQK